MKSYKTVFFLIPLVHFFLFSGSLHAASGLIEEVIFHGNDGKTESVVFHLDGPWLPKAFALKGEKPRVVFDFMETSLARSVPTTIDAQGTMIRQIRMGRYTNKTRVVIDLNVGGEYNFDQQFDETKNILTIQLFSNDFPEKEEKRVEKKEIAGAVVKETESIAPPENEGIVKETAAVVIPAVELPEEAVTAPVEAVRATEAFQPPKDEHVPLPDSLLSDVSFENTANKGEMVLFKLNGFYPPTVKGEEEGTPLVICEFAGARLGENVVKDQVIPGEYVKRVDVQHIEESDLIRVTLELVPNKNYDLQQVFFKEDNLFVVIVNSYDSQDKTKKEQ